MPVARYLRPCGRVGHGQHHQPFHQLRVRKHLRQVPDPSFCIDITGFMQKREDAILAYESQFVIPEKNRRVVDWLRDLSAYLGGRIGCEHAEPFFVKETLGLSGIEGLVM